MLKNISSFPRFKDEPELDEQIKKSSELQLLIRTLSRFCAWLLLLLLSIGGFNSWQINYHVPNLDATTLFAGDSYINSAINPAYIPQSINVAQAAEPYQVTYFKLRKLLKDNPTIKRVYLGCSYHNISSYNDYKFKHPKIKKVLFQRLYPLLTIEEILNWQPNRLTLWKVYAKEMFTKPQLQHDNYIGEYDARPSELTTAPLQSTLQRHYAISDSAATISTTQLHYLSKMIALTKQLNVELILVATPLHESYRREVPASFIAAFRTLQERMLAEKVAFLDYSDYLLPNEAFFDYDHLSEVGATLFSTHLGSTLAF